MQLGHLGMVNRECIPGGQNWDYYPDGLSLSQVTVAQ